MPSAIAYKSIYLEKSDCDKTEEISNSAGSFLLLLENDFNNVSRFFLFDCDVLHGTTEKMSISRVGEYKGCLRRN